MFKICGSMEAGYISSQINADKLKKFRVKLIETSEREKQNIWKLEVLSLKWKEDK
jgi:hypothetical protein